MPVRAYIPPGTLREVVAYPRATEAYDASAIAKALADVGLEHLASRLDEEDRWDRELTDDEKQRLVFARVILQKPHWVVLNDALDVLDPVSRERIEAVLANELGEVGIVNIGREETESGLFPTTLHLVMDPLGPTFRPGDQQGILDQLEPSREAFSVE
jgi:vitamin B12/bleomycin/antimicrobial peptide transport system ATP-binding/permease protein